jgi:glycogen phosphorylase
LSEVPITAITNGVHARSCVAKSTQELYDRYLGLNWAEAPADAALWDRVKTIPDEELWRNHERCRSALVVFVRDRLQRTLSERGASPTEIAHAQDVLDPSVLTIGFARRFATYKRATLFLRNLDRLHKILQGNHGKHSTKRGVQFVIAGKAHPKDIPGKELIRDIVHFTRTEELRHHIVFVPDYDIYVSRLMVAGCDVWLNTPRRPREASGTSGMKASMNGLPNLSVLDGWWDEADYVRTGWAIGHGEVYADETTQDEVEANALYNLLEQEVLPLFYDRDAEDIPHRWLAKMKDTIRLNCPRFNTARMVGDYASRAYFAASDRYAQMTADHNQPAKALAAWKAHLFNHWYDIKIVDIDISEPADIQVNQTVRVKAIVHLGKLTAEDIQVQLYQGDVNIDGEISDGTVVAMVYQGQDDRGQSLYQGQVAYQRSGLQGLSLRVLPIHPLLSNPYGLGLILWAQP